MTVRKKKKVGKLRGSKTHGFGIKKHRGAGNRGGRGNAGTGKRGDQKKPTILKLFGNKYYGKHGFKRPASKIKKIKAINIENLPQQANINLTELGYNKLLAKGTPKLKYEITVESFSKKAKEKIEKAGGKIKEK